jgi:hypothetical protein
MRRLHKIIPGVAVMFASENICKGDRFGELLGSHQKSGSIGVPDFGHGKLQLQGQSFSFKNFGWSFVFRVIVNLRVHECAVNYPLVVQSHGGNGEFLWLAMGG